jgi:Ca-activated chloride channel family protein
MRLLKISSALLFLTTTIFFLSSCGEPDPSSVKRVDPLSEPSTSTEKGSISLKRNLYFVFDGSGSMLAAPPESGEQHFSSKIDAAKWAVREFMKSVPDDVNLGLYVFDSGGEREVVPLAPNNRAAFLQAIESVDSGGATPLGAAIGQGAGALVSEYKKQLGYGDYRLIVITDGDATDPINKGITIAEKYNLPIYTIGFGIGEEHSLRKHSVSYKSADSATELKDALKEAVAELDMFEPTKFSNK